MTITVTPAFTGSLTVSNDLSSVAALVSYAAGTDLAQGTGSMSADKAFSDTITFTASTAVNIDFAASASQTDVFGSALNMAKTKAILIKNKAAAGSGATITVGNGTNPCQLGFGATTSTWTIPAQGIMLVTAPDTGWAITGSTADILKLTPSAHAFDADLVFIGTSA